MTNNLYQKTINKIIKLLDLAGSSHSEHEMASALEKVRKLLQKHGLTMEQVDKSRVESTLGVGDGWKIEAPKSEKSVWVNHLAAIIGEYFECKVARSKDTFVFYGPSLPAQSASYGFKSIYNQILELADNFKINEYTYFSKGAAGLHQIKSYAAYCRQAKKEYRTGLAIGLEKHLNELKEKELIANTNGKLDAIVLVSMDIADAWAKENNIILQEDGKKHQSHKVTGTKNCMKGVDDSRKLQVKKGLTDGTK